MAWITPKTDWQPTDPLTHNDYNRIKNNLIYLNDIYNVSYGEYDFNPGDDMVVDQMYKASTWNMFEDCVEQFQRSGIVYTFGERSYYHANGHLPNYVQLNRLEQCTLAYSNVDIPVRGVTLVPNELAMLESDTQQIEVDIIPSNAKNKNISISLETASGSPTVQYSYDSSTGYITVTSDNSDYGILSLIVTTEDGGYQASCDITVGVIHVESISVSPAYVNPFYVGDTIDFTVTVLPEDAADKSFSISYAGGYFRIVTIGNTVHVTCLKYSPNFLTLTFTTTDRELSKTVNVITRTKGSYYEHDLEYPLDFMLVGKGDFNTVISKYALPKSLSYNGTYYNPGSVKSNLHSACGEVFAYFTANLKAAYASVAICYSYLRSDGIVNGGIYPEHYTEPMSIDTATAYQYDKRYSEVYGSLPSGVYSDYNISYLNTNALRKAYNIKNKNQALPYFLRSYYSENQVFIVNTSGIRTAVSNSTTAYIRPLFYFNNELKVYRNPVADGAYIICWDSEADSILVSSLPLGSVIRDVPYES